MKTPQPPPSKIGNRVEFSPPVSVAGAPTRRGVVKDEVWSQIHKDTEWGNYIYTSQLIAWDEGGQSVRITYYYQPEGAQRWLFGGQYSIEDSPKVIRDILQATLSKDWYAA